MKNLLKNSLVVFGILIALSLGSLSNAYAVGLKQEAVLKDSVITLGDIFYDLPENSSKVLGPAPRPGSDMVLNARTLMRIALALDLPWRPSSSSEYIVLRRSATLISARDIQDQLTQAIAQEGYGENIEIVFPSETSEIVLPEDQDASFDIVTLDIDRTKNWFEASIAAPSKDNPIRSARISGKIHRMVEVPVLRETLRNGSIIGTNDIDMVAMRERDISPQMLIDAAAVMGMTPRRVIFAGRPILDKEVEAPQIVGRGEAVTVILKKGAMTLTAAGRSLENGAKGDLVRVVNASSNHTIQGIVTGDKEITIQEF